MDSSNVLSRRAGNVWLPAGLAALLWSLEKADPISRHWKSLKITQAVKSLLQTGSGQSERCSQRQRISSLGLFFDSMRDFHSKVSACSNFGIGVSFHAPVSCPKFYCGEDDCERSLALIGVRFLHSNPLIRSQAPEVFFKYEVNLRTQGSKDSNKMTANCI